MGCKINDHRTYIEAGGRAEKPGRGCCTGSRMHALNCAPLAAQAVKVVLLSLTERRTTEAIERELRHRPRSEVSTSEETELGGMRLGASVIR